jgi:hypothetical protein
VVYTAPGIGPIRMSTAIFDTWVAHGGVRGPLGEATDVGLDGTTEFLILHGGTITRPAGGAPQVHLGQHSSVRQEADPGCTAPDRPCITAAQQSPATT